MKNLVAVYGSLRSGFSNHDLLDRGGAVQLGDDVIHGDYTMLNLGGFPGLILEGDTPITIEVYAVDDRVFNNLDRLEGYPTFYNRKKVGTAHGEAWIYYLNEPRYPGREWAVVSSGDWADARTPCF